MHVCKKILKILTTTMILLLFLFTSSFLTACRTESNSEKAEIAEDEDISTEEDITEETLGRKDITVKEEGGDMEEDIKKETDNGEIEEKTEEIPEMIIESPSFKNNEMIPAKYTCDAENINPALFFSGIPSAAASLVLIVDDPDAPGGTWVHWTVWNMDPGTTEIAENSVPGSSAEGNTDFGTPGYGGPCPPSGTHRYFFKLYALDITLELDASARAADIEDAMQGHILGSTELIGLYERS